MYERGRKNSSEAAPLQQLYRNTRRQKSHNRATAK